MKKRCTAILLILCATATLAAARAQKIGPDEQRTLRTRIEQHYDVVALSDGIALRPKQRTNDVRLIEISDVIAINGVQVSGRELRERVGADADVILRLSYLDASTRRAIFGPDAVVPARPDTEAEVEAEQPARREERGGRQRRTTGREIVRIFGDISVGEDEHIAQQAVAVIGSIRVDGEVGDQVVAVLGSVNLGPKAVVRGDVVSVGGRIRRAPGAQIHGNVTEVSLGGNRLHVSPWIGGDGIPLPFLDGLGALPRLFGSVFRYVLLALLASMALVIGRRTVEASAQRVRENPIQAVFVGVAAAILLVPVLALTAFVLAISIIGIPLLLLIPFAVVLLGLLALAGFSGTAYAVGQAARRRFGSGGQAPLIDVCVGVGVILLPVLLARVVALAGWALDPISWLLLAAGLGLEFLAWSGGFGAVLTNTFARWQMTRAARATPPPPATA